MGIPFKTNCNDNYHWCVHKFN